MVTFKRRYNVSLLIITMASNAAQKLPLLNINTATFNELIQIPSIGKTKAIFLIFQQPNITSFNDLNVANKGIIVT